MNIKEISNDLVARYGKLESIRPNIEEAAITIINAYRNKKKLLVCGNGGSAADSEHIVGELMKGFILKRPVPSGDKLAIAQKFPGDAEYLASNLQQSLPAISLVSHTSLITAYMNDVAADMVFAQQVYGYGEPGDVLIAISTSGNSANIINAVKIASAFGLKIIAMTNESGGMLRDFSDIILITAPASETFKTQEYHLAIYHALCMMAEAELFEM